MFCYELAVTNRVFRGILDLSPGWLSMEGVGYTPLYALFSCHIRRLFNCLLLALLLALFARVWVDFTRVWA